MAMDTQTIIPSFDSLIGAVDGFVMNIPFSYLFTLSSYQHAVLSSLDSGSFCACAWLVIAGC